MSRRTARARGRARAPRYLSWNRFIKPTMGDVEVYALRGISLNIREGELWRMGTSGSGNLHDEHHRLSGSPDEGQVHILDGEACRRCLRMSAQTLHLKTGLRLSGLQFALAHSSALENVRAADALRGQETAERHSARWRPCALSGWRGARAQSFRTQLSGGQQQESRDCTLAGQPTGADLSPTDRQAISIR